MPRTRDITTTVTLEELAELEWHKHTIEHPNANNPAIEAIAKRMFIRGYQRALREKTTDCLK